MTLGTPNTLPNFKCKNISIKNSVSEKPLDTIIDNKLDFTEHRHSVRKRENLKLHALNRISSFLSPEKRVIITNAYIKSIFNYCQFVWMLCYWWTMHKINKIHERYWKATRWFPRSLKVFFCIKSLLTEVYKYINGLSPEIIKEVFSTRANIYNITQFNVFETQIPTLNRPTLNSIPYKARQLCNLLPENLKSSPSLTLFENEIKLWDYFNSPRSICNSHVPNLGYRVLCN